MDASAVVGSAAALLGVGLGALLTARSQTALQRQTLQESSRQRQVAACIEFLAVYRRFRRFLMSEESISVELVPVDDRPDLPTPLARGIRRQWDAYEGARSTFEVVVGDPQLLEVATKMQDALWAILRARADFRAGAIPDAIITPAQTHEREFRRLAHELSLSTAGIE